MNDETPRRVLVGFSGGVDSAMTAVLLRERGHEVALATMAVADGSGQGCGVTQDLSAARALAEKLALPLTVVDCGKPYRKLVLDYFRDEYLAGRTPNPCVRCNLLVKFGLFPELARRQGLRFDRFATGHYARIQYRPDFGRHVLMRGVDTAKDQSYFLYRLDADTLSRTLFPLGAMRKDEVRALARERGLAVHDKPDSQDFYAGDYADLLGVAETPGNIVDVRGKVLGTHRGYWRFTPGQRRGLGVAFTEPLYVIAVRPERNEVVAGTGAERMRRGCVIGDTLFNPEPPPAGARLRGRLRSAQPFRGMRIGEAPPDGGMLVLFDEPVSGVAPGQSLVLYDGDRVVGGGVIQKGTD